MNSATLLSCLVLVVVAAFAPVTGQRITTIQLDGVQYFISRMNPYSPELNYFLAYQYCRSLGLQLASFETKEKADSITTYLTNAGYNKYDFWTSGNNLGTDMYLWMSTGLPFNATFNYMRREAALAVDAAPASDSMDPLDMPQGSTAPQRTARHGTEHVMTNGCITLKAPSFHWEPQHCAEIKDFICEQTRCYYYNYGSIPVSSAQG
uniref:C-type lectin-S4 n=1 Tax=Hepialus xiaojinensis TaxID=1589740 RepID=A0A219YXF9_9NEOP|nr:C-type lectin-S4 [Hepialus xiaojinensis]